MRVLTVASSSTKAPEQLVRRRLRVVSFLVLCRLANRNSAAPKVSKQKIRTLLFRETVRIFLGLGRLYADELGTIDIPEHIQNYFDYEAYGRDVRINEGGVFAPGG